MNVPSHTLPPETEAQFVGLVRLYRPQMRAMVTAVLPGTSDTDDVLQEATVAMWKKFADYDPSRPFLNWALSFARLQALAQVKKRGREHTKLSELALDAVERSIVNAANDGVWRSHEDDQIDALQRCIAKRTEEERSLLRRRYHDGYSIPEIATVHSPAVGVEALYKKFQRLHQALLLCIERRLARSFTN